LITQEGYDVRRRGVSSIISVLLLIVIAVAAAVVTYGFVMGFIGGTTTTTTQTQARIVVEGVQITDFNGSHANITVYVRNTGQVEVNVDRIYLYYANGTGIAASQTASGSNPLPVNSVGSYSVTNIPAASGSYYVKVTTQEGAQAPSEVFTISS